MISKGKKKGGKANTKDKDKNKNKKAINNMVLDSIFGLKNN